MYEKTERLIGIPLLYINTPLDFETLILFLPLLYNLCLKLALDLYGQN